MTAMTQTRLTGTQCWSSSHDGRFQHLMVLFHGANSSGELIAPLGGRISRALPNTYVFSPNGPKPTGDHRFGWLGEPRLENPAEPPGEPYDRLSRDINQTLDLYQEEFGLADADTIFVGIAEGAAAALGAALTRPRRIAGVLCFAGPMSMPPELLDEIRSRPPVCLIHGNGGSKFSPDSLSATYRFLKRAGVPLTSHMCRTAKHDINGEAFSHGTRFLSKVLDQ
ncbi:MAG: hypothetical protein QF393_07325 [Rhodospirillales bacterium]|jgi:phospholipase/carboxylesterase|nr:hypothetical protein [Rhodospirillaceae bacterium]MDP6427812.1 hypothetical protein [Rhodospirillales bacterium]MDP6644554.1 hypothetical protein [Rhodospirillales bacterium]